jgi:hypothetical protein
MSSNVFTGSCLCGAVQFQVTPPTKWCANCHCSMCRRAHGAAFVTFVGVLLPQLEITAGADRLTRFPSSQAATRSFCSACGSTLFFESTRWAGEIHIARANFHGDIDHPVQAHAFFDHRADWWPIDDDLPKLGGPTGNQPLK